eukprot:3348114-Ditylum_brightwellii.AAC.1
MMMMLSRAGYLRKEPKIELYDFYLHKGSELGGTKIVLKEALPSTVIAITCNDRNFAIKAGPTAFKEAEKYLCVKIVLECCCAIQFNNITFFLQLERFCPNKRLGNLSI